MIWWCLDNLATRCRHQTTCCNCLVRLGFSGTTVLERHDPSLLGFSAADEWVKFSRLLNRICWKTPLSLCSVQILYLTVILHKVETELIDNIWWDLICYLNSVLTQRVRSGNRINLFTCKLVGGVCLDENNQANEGTWGLGSIRNLHAVLSIQPAIVSNSVIIYRERTWKRINPGNLTD